MLLRMKEYFLSIKRFFGPFAVVAILLAAVGCGGSEDPTTTADTTTVDVSTLAVGQLSKSGFIKRADSLCESARAKFGKEYEAFLRENNATSSSERQNELLPKAVATILVPTYEEAIGAIVSLGSPKGDQTEVKAFLEAMQDGFARMNKKPDASFTNTYFAQAVALGNRYGLTGCVQSLS